MKRTLLALSFASLTVTGCGELSSTSQQANQQTTAAASLPSVQQQTESQRLNRWLDDSYEQQLRFSPISLAYLGRKALYDQYDDMSEAAQDTQLAWYKSKIAEMKAQFDYQQLDLEAKTSWDYFEYLYQQRARAAQFRRNHYVFEQFGGPQSAMPSAIISYHVIDNLADAQALVKRIAGMARAMHQLIDRAELGIQAGVRPPQFAYQGVLKEAKAIITGQPFEQTEAKSALWEYGLSSMEALLKSGVASEQQASEFKQALTNVLVAQVGPAYQRLIAMVEADLPNAMATPQSTGIVNLPNAKAYYQERLATNTTTDLSAEQIHQIGLQEVERITNEMLAIKEQVGFKGELNDFFEFIRTDEQFFYPDTDEGRQGYLDDSTAYLNNIEHKLPQYFGLLPKAKLVVKRVEPYREQDGAAQHYQGSSPDGSRPGVYYAHLSDMRAMPKTDMEAVAYHEGNPGHHMQSAIAIEHSSLPLFRRNEWLSAYGEGWALYTELLAKEMGAYQNPYSDFGRLSAEIWRAARLVVDTGLHHKGWTEQQAVAYMMQVVPSTLPAMTSEVHRYQVWPGQATSYKIGMLKILELRERAEKQLAEQYNIREFHDVVLGGGSLPLALLEKRVDQWIASKL